MTRLLTLCVEIGLEPILCCFPLSVTCFLCVFNQWKYVEKGVACKTREDGGGALVEVKQ